MRAPNPPKKTPLIAILFASILVAAILTYFLTRPTSTEAGWFSDAWNYRNKVPLTNNTTAQTNVFVNMTIDTSSASQFQADCGDLRFTDNGGKLLPYYVVSGCASSSTVIHVFMQNFPAGLQDLYYYYGNPVAPNGFSMADFPTEATNYTVGSVGSQEIGGGPVSYWKFDDGYGTTVNDSMGRNNGTLSGNATPIWATEDVCVSGKCLYFGGSTSYVNAGNSTSIGFTTSFTVSAWIRPTNFSAQHDIIAKNGASGSYGYSFYTDSNGKLNLQVSSNGTTTFVATGGTTLTTNQWYFVTGTYNNGTSLTVYVNGKQDGQNTTSIPSTINSSAAIPLNIGAENEGVSNLFPGSIDEVRIYNYVRGSGQILTDYTGRGSDKGSGANLGSNQENLNAVLGNGLLGYWPLDETATPALDYSGNNNNGTWTGSPSSIKGEFARAINLNGSTQYVNMTSPAAYNLTNSISLSAWVKPTSVNSTNQTIAGWGGTGNDGYKIYMTNTNKFSLFTNGGEVVGSTTPVNGTWYHVTGTIDASGTVGSIYVNGKLENSGTVAISAGTGPFLIGRNPSSSAQFFTGAIDEVRLYKRALTESDDFNLFNWAPEPVAYWRMDENSGNFTYTIGANASNNYTGQLGNGTVANMPKWVAGKINSGLKFDGVNDDITILNSAGLFNNVTTFTISTWVKFGGLSDYAQVISKGSSPDYYSIDLSGASEGGNNDVEFCISNGADTCAYTSANIITTNRWYYITGVYDGSQPTNATRAKLYVNGVPQSLSFTGSIPTNTSTNINSLYFGASLGDSFFLNGTVDEAKLYNYPRTQKQILQDMNMGHPAGNANSMVGYWKFDEGYGNTTSNFGFLGGSANGTLSGSPLPTWDNNGKFGKALTFEGTAAYMDASGVASSVATGDYSASLWFKPAVTYDSSLTVDKYLLSLGDPSSYNDFHLVFSASDGRLRYQSFDSGLNQQEIYTTKNSWTAGEWHHAAITFSSTSGEKLYIDGVLVGQNAAYTTRGSPNSTLLYLAYNGGFQTYFSGTVDEFKIYNYTLTPDEVKLDYNHGSSSSLGSTGTNSSGVPDNSASRAYCPPGDNTSSCGPAAEWRFDENTGTTAYDMSGNNNSGILGAGNATFRPSWVSGKSGSALKFNGTNQYVEVADNASLRPGAGNWTMSAWVKPTDSDQLSPFIIKYQAAAPNAAYYFGICGDSLCNTAGQFLAAGIVQNASTSYRSVRSTTDVADGNWHYYSMVSDVTSNAIRLYMDGIELGTAATIAGSWPNYTDTSVLHLGGDTNFSLYYSGPLDQVVFYNYARTASQIAWDYNRGAPLVWYKMDECQGAILYDSSPKADRPLSRYDGNLTIGGSGTQNITGTCTGNTTSAWKNGANGKFGSSLYFDGSDDSAKTSTAIALNTTKTISTSFWLNWDSYANNDSLAMESSTNFNDNAGAILIDPNSSTAGGDFELVIHGSGYLSESFPRPSAGAWHHYTIIFDASTSNGSITVYVDGIKQTTTNHSNTLNGPYGFGNYVWYFMSRAGTSLFGAGKMDDVRIYPYPLTFTQIQNIYNESSSVRFAPVTGPP